MLDSIKGVIFDLDGTLVDSMWVWVKIDMDFIKERNLTIPHEELMKDVAHCSFSQTAEYFRTRFGMTESTEEIMEIWNKMAEKEYGTNVFLKPGAKDFLDDLKKRGIKLALATSNSRHLLTTCLSANGITEYFDVLVTTDESTARTKSEPDVFLLAAERMGVDPKDIFVFEDVSHSMVGAKKAGMRVIGIKDKYSATREEDVEDLCELFIEDFTGFSVKEETGASV